MMIMRTRIRTLKAFAGCLALTLTLVSWTCPSTTTAYVITAPNVVPIGRQMKFLRELTSDLVQAAPGQLTPQQLAVSHELMYAWSHAAATSASATTTSMNRSHKPPQPPHEPTSECAAVQVELLLKRVIDERMAGNLDAALDTNDYNCLLEGWARSGLGEAAALRTEQILEVMQQQGPTPNLSSFKACLMAWRQANVPYAALRAQRILDWMIRLHQDENAQQASLPDADCFDIVLQLTSRSGHAQAPQQTERVLMSMHQLYRRTGLDKVKPRHSSFNAVLLAWSKSKWSTETLTHMTKLLSVMELAAESDPLVGPDAVSYNIVMSTLAKQPNVILAAAQADALLRHIVTLYQKQSERQSGRYGPSFCPEPLLFNIAIGLWAKSGTTGSYRKARSILQKQLSLAREPGSAVAMPDIVGWTSVLTCCAAEPGHAQERDRAFQAAIATYRQLKSLDGGTVSANYVTYGTMLKACAKLHPIKSPLRETWARRVFADAVSAGCVGDMVVSKLREAVPHEVYRELLQGHSRHKLPAAWTMNVCEQSEFRYRQAKRGGKRAEV
jgi:hypothetical protein